MVKTTATCKGCGESHTADSESEAETYIVHKDGCGCNLTNPEAWITFGAKKKKPEE